MTVTGTLTWSGGTHQAPGTTTVAAPGRILVTDCDDANLGEGRRLRNLGRLVLGGGSSLSAYGDDRPEIHNAGRIELDSAGACGSYTGIVGDALLANGPTGTIEKLGGAGSSYLGNLDNDGLVLDSAAGDLRLGSDAAVGHSGTFRATGAGAVAFDDGDFALEPGSVIDGNAAITGADVRPGRGMTLEVPAGDTLTLAAGSLSGAGDVRVSGALAWTGGRQEGTGTTVVEPGGTVTVAPAAGDDEAYASMLGSRSLVNRGAMTLDDASLFLRDGASVLNRGTLELRGATALEGSSFGDGFDALVHNVGVLRKAGTSTIRARVPVDNDGTVDVQAGSLELPEPVELDRQRLLRGVRPRGRGLRREGHARTSRRGQGQRRPPRARRRRVEGDHARLHGPRVRRARAARAHRGRGRARAAGRPVADGRRRPGQPRHPRPRSGLDPRCEGLPADRGRRTAAGRRGRRGGPGRRERAGAARRPDRHAGRAGAGGRSSRALRTLGGGRVRRGHGQLQRLPVGDRGAAATARRRPARPGHGRRTGDGGRTRSRAGARARRAPVAADAPRQRRRAALVAARRGARVSVRAVRGRELALVVRTCRRCGSVRVRWAGRERTISLAGRRARRTVPVFTLRRARAGRVRITAVSDRRVAVRALLVRP